MSDQLSNQIACTNALIADLIATIKLRSNVPGVQNPDTGVQNPDAVTAEPVAVTDRAKCSKVEPVNCSVTDIVNSSIIDVVNCSKVEPDDVVNCSKVEPATFESVSCSEVEPATFELIACSIAEPANFDNHVIVNDSIVESDIFDFVKGSIDELTEVIKCSIANTVNCSMVEPAVDINCSIDEHANFELVNDSIVESNIFETVKSPSDGPTVIFDPVNINISHNSDNTHMIKNVSNHQTSNPTHLTNVCGTITAASSRHCTQNENSLSR